MTATLAPPSASAAIAGLMPDRYFHVDERAPADPISGQRPKTLRYGVGGKWKESTSGKYMPCYDPSTGAVIARAPQCTAAEVEEAIEAAAARLSGLARHAGRRCAPRSCSR